MTIEHAIDIFLLLRIITFVLLHFFSTMLNYYGSQLRIFKKGGTFCVNGQKTIFAFHSLTIDCKAPLQMLPLNYQAKEITLIFYNLVLKNHNFHSKFNKKIRKKLF